MPASEDIMNRMASSQTFVELSKRLNIPLTPTSPAGLVEADTVDPWNQSGKYALGWTYFCLVLVFLVTITRMYHYWTDKLRQALYKEEQQKNAVIYSPETEWGMANMETGRTAEALFPRTFESKEAEIYQSRWSSIGPINDTLALFRWIFYRPIPEIHWKFINIVWPSLAITSLLIVMLAFVALYCFLPQPLYWQSIQYGSPPLAIRAGMIAIAMTPWIIATSMKANLISMMTGISHERLNVLHRWGGYLCLFLSLVHMIPFYITPVWQDNGMSVFNAIFPDGSGIIYGTGIACFVPLCWLCIASLPIIRSKFYELFLILHIPASFVYVGLLFWHCKNYLTSWQYLYATLVIWVFSYLLRIFNLNWANPRRLAWLIGDEAAVTLMSENAIKVTIPTQMKWRPGQFVYLRMPGISIFENHPFTISSLCSEDFPSEYGEMYRDCTLVFRPFGGFTRRVLDTAIEKGPFKTYRVVSNTIYIPPGSKITGEGYPVILATGSVFGNINSPVPVFQVGKSGGEKGTVEWSNMIVSTKGAAPGATLIEWNLDATGLAPAGMWDVHTRIGGFKGSNLQVGQCPTGTFDSRNGNVTMTSANLPQQCIGAFMSMHVTKPATNLYMENVWLWVADHDVDDSAETQITIFAGRGLLVESTAGAIWMYGTAVEHHALYQYQLANTANIYMGEIQTETPYYQPNPNTAIPFPAVASLNDPPVESDALGLRILSSNNILVYGAGLYSFFSNYNVHCSDAGNGEWCQSRIFSVEKSSAITVYGLDTVGTQNMITVDGTNVASFADNIGATQFIDTIAMFKV